MTREPDTPVFTRAVVGDVAAGALSPYSRTAGPAAALPAAWAAAYDAALGPRPGTAPPVRWDSGHPWADGTPAALLAAALPWPGGTAPVPAVTTWFADVVHGPADAPALAAATARAHGLRDGRPDLPVLDCAALEERRLGIVDALGAGVALVARADLAAGAVTLCAGRTTPAPPAARAPDPEEVLWEMGRAVARDAQLLASFDSGTAALAGRLAASRTEAGRALHQALASVAAEWGHLGPDPWELEAGTWGTAPAELLGIVDLLRTLPDDLDPGPRRRAVHARRCRVRPADDALHRAAGRWSTARDRATDTVAVLAHELRLVTRVQAERAARTGLVDAAEDYYQLDRDEVPGLRTGGAALAHRLRLRGYDHRALHTFRPPPRVTGPPPPAVRWPRAGEAARPGPGEVLRGTAAAPGTATGAAVVLRSPSDLSAARAGDVLVVPTGCATWRPVLPAAVAVVVDAGWALSPVAVTCHELGVPCVVGADAGGVLATGVPVEVDGDRGTVTVTDGPARHRHPAGRARRR